MPCFPGLPFYERLNELLDETGFDRFGESCCEKFYAVKMGRPSVRPGICFRMLMIGYFEKPDSERQIDWHCSDSLSWRAFLGLEPQANTPDHSSLSRTRQRIDLETHQAVFDWVLKRLAEYELLKGRTLAVDASTMEANAAMRSIVRKETGAIVAAEIHPADQGDTTTLSGTLARATESLREVRDDDTVAADTTGLMVKEVVADKGYHSSQTLLDLEEIDLRSYISEPDRGRRRWTAKDPQRQASKRAEQTAVYGNRRRQKGHRAKRLHRQRGERVERPFDHLLDDGGMRRRHLKGRQQVAKRYLIHIAAFNLGLIMRQLTGFGTPKGWADGLGAWLLRFAGRWWVAWARQSGLPGVLRPFVAPEPTSTSRALAA